MNDYDLLDRWTAGDRSAAQELFERYFEPLYRFFRGKCSSVTDVEDLVQDTFAAIVAGRQGFRREASFRSYLFGTARNKLLRHWRDRKPSVELSEVAQTALADLDPSPSVLLLRKQEERVLLEALRRLPLDSQIVLELFAWENLTAREVAEILELGEAAARSRWHRAKLDLRKNIEAIVASPEVLQSTLANLDAWARAIRHGR